MAEIDPLTLSELNLNLRALSNDLGKLGNDRLITALGQLGARLDRRLKSDQDRDQSVKDFVQQVNTASDATRAQARATQAQTKATETNIQAQRKSTDTAYDIERQMRREALMRGSLLSEEVRNQREMQDIARSRLRSDLETIRSMNSWGGIMNSLAGSTKLGDKTFRNLNIALLLGGEALKGLTKFAGEFGRSLAGLTSATFGAATAMAKGESGFTVFNGMIDSAASALTSLGKSIPFFGAAVGAVSAGFKFLLDMSQMVTESMNNVARTGGLGAGGMDAFAAQAGRAGLSLRQMEKVTTENANVLARFGGTVSDGAERFSRITGELILGPLGTELRMLGFNREQIAESTTGFLNQQIRLGTIRGKTEAQLTAGAAKYAKELDILAKLTGQTREEVQKQQDAALSESRFRAALDGMDETTAKRFLDFQNMLNKAAPEMAAGFRDITSGFPTTAAAQEFLRLGGQQIIDSIMSGTGSADAFRQLQGLIEPQIESARGLALAVGDEVRVIGKYTELRDVLTAKIVDGDIQLQRAQKEQIENAGDLTKSLANAQEALDELQIKIQQVALALVPTAATAITKFTKALDTGLDQLKDILGLGGVEGSMWKWVGAAAGAVIGQQIGSMLGGLLGAIVGFLAGGPAGAALGATIGSAAGGGIAAIIAGLAGYNVGQNADQVGPIEALSQFGNNLTQAIKPEVLATPRPPAADLETRATRSVDQPGGGRDRYAGMRSDRREAPSTSTAPNLDNVKPENLFDFRGGLTGRRENFDNLEPTFKARLAQMAFEYRKTTGKRLPISSGARTQEENAAVKGVPNSRHLQGLAVDLSADSVNELKRLGLLDAYKFKQSNKDAWHISDDGFRLGGISRGPKSGYSALLHGIEAVVPLPDGKKIPVDIRMPEIKNPLEDIDFRRVESEVTGVVDRMSQNFQRTLEDLVRRIAMNPAVESALQELVSLQRSNNSTQERLLQVSVN